jgi:hypothetical protein
VFVIFEVLLGNPNQVEGSRWVNKVLGRAIAQSVSRRLPTAAARVRTWVRSCGICSTFIVREPINS